MIIDNGNYYLLGFDEIKKNMRTYRVDRMTNVKIQKEYNADPKKFDDIDIEHYTQEHFGMFGGELERVTLNCSIRLLETMIDRFGLEGMSYIPAGKSFFDVRISVYVSDQFFGWILGFGKKAKLLYPDVVINQFKAYMDKIREMY